MPRARARVTAGELAGVWDVSAAVRGPVPFVERSASTSVRIASSAPSGVLHQRARGREHTHVGPAGSRAATRHGAAAPDRLGRAGEGQAAHGEGGTAEGRGLGRAPVTDLLGPWPIGARRAASRPGRVTRGAGHRSSRGRLGLRSLFTDLASVGRVHSPSLPVRALLRDPYQSSSISLSFRLRRPSCSGPARASSGRPELGRGGGRQPSCSGSEATGADHKDPVLRPGPQRPRASGRRPGGRSGGRGTTSSVARSRAARRFRTPRATAPRRPVCATQMHAWDGPGTLVANSTTQPTDLSRLLPGNLVFNASTEDGTAVDHVGIDLGKDSAGLRGSCPAADGGRSDARGRRRAVDARRDGPVRHQPARRPRL